jgi:hypothetical protein
VIRDTIQEFDLGKNVPETDACFEGKNQLEVERYIFEKTWVLYGRKLRERGFSSLSALIFFNGD